MSLTDRMKGDPAAQQIYFKDSGGNYIAVDEDNPLPTSGGGTTGDVTIAPGDVQIGAVEIKDGATDQRAVVDGTGQLSVKDAAVVAAVDGLEGLIALTNAALATIDGRVDGLEALVAATNAALATIDGHVDGVETLLTTQAGYLDGLEGKLDVLHADVDGVEGKLDTLNTSVVESRDPDGVATTQDDIAVDATATGVVILAANAARKGFVVQNTGLSPIRVSIGSGAVANHGIQLAAGASLAMSAPYCPVGVIKAIREGANSSTCAAIEVV